MNTLVAPTSFDTLLQTFGDPRALRMDPEQVQTGDYVVIGQNDLVGGIWILRPKDGHVPATAFEGTVIAGQYFFTRHPVTKQTIPDRGRKLLDSSGLSDRFSFRQEHGKEMDGIHLPFLVLVAK